MKELRHVGTLEVPLKVPLKRVWVGSFAVLFKEIFLVEQQRTKREGGRQLAVEKFQSRENLNYFIIIIIIVNY